MLAWEFERVKAKRPVAVSRLVPEEPAAVRVLYLAQVFFHRQA